MEIESKQARRNLQSLFTKIRFLNTQSIEPV